MSTLISQDWGTNKSTNDSRSMSIGSNVLDGDFGWVTPNDIRGLSDQDVRGALLSSMDFRIADLSTNFSTLGTTNPGSTLHTLVMICSKALSIMFFYYKIRSFCLAWRSSRSFTKHAFSSKASTPIQSLDLLSKLVFMGSTALNFTL